MGPRQRHGNRRIQDQEKTDPGLLPEGHRQDVRSIARNSVAKLSVWGWMGLYPLDPLGNLVAFIHQFLCLCR